MRNKIIQGCSLELLATLSDKSVDMVFADPPYNLQLSSELVRPDQSAVSGVFDKWDQFDSFAHYDRWSSQWLGEVRRVMKDDATLWVIGSYHNIFRVGALMQSLGFWILNDIIWRKSNPMPNFRGTRFTNAHETLIWAGKSQKSKYTFNYKALKVFNDDLQMRSDDWVMPLCTGGERLKDEAGNKLHSTQKPLGLVARTILTASNRGDLILDPFAGTGTTPAAAKMLGRDYLALERDETYIQAARTRVAKIKKLDDAALEMMAASRREQRIPFGRIVEERLIKPGTKLYDVSQKFSALVRVDGSLACGGLTGSIHSVAANLLERESCNGWTFWHYLVPKKIKNPLMPIDTLRQEMRGRLSA